MSVPRLDFFTDDAPAEPAPASLIPDAGVEPVDEAVPVGEAHAEAEPDEDFDEDYSEAEPADEPVDSATAVDAGDDTAEEKDAAVPASASEYDLSAFGPDDAMAQSFAPVAHKLGIPQKGMTEIASWLNGALAAQEAEFQKADIASAKAVTATLRKELGESNFTRTIDAAKQAIADLGPIGEQIRQARLPNGTRLTNDPKFVLALARIAGEFTLPSDPAERQRAIEKIRDTNIQKYWDLGLDKELSKLQHSAKQPAAKPTAPRDFGAPSSVTIDGKNYQAASDAVDAEKQALESLMHSNIDDYMNRPWRNTGKTASARLLEINRKAAQRR